MCKSEYLKTLHNWVNEWLPWPTWPIYSQSPITKPYKGRVTLAHDIHNPWIQQPPMISLKSSNYLHLAMLPGSGLVFWVPLSEVAWNRWDCKAKCPWSLGATRKRAREIWAPLGTAGRSGRNIWAPIGTTGRHGHHGPTFMGATWTLLGDMSIVALFSWATVAPFAQFSWELFGRQVSHAPI